MSFSKARKRVNLSQSDVARSLGVDQSTVSLWETGNTMPRSSLLPRIANLYKCDIDELFADDDVTESSEKNGVK